ncbi:prominin-1-A-like isoform X1 [Amblyraja radiata]|uniref:prominin-1-A-like isoform X1 n=2 Tax=Amblyraja radiata TaxID=386614 RepID=UPI00140362D7|nr:prominin-1-A-like isoform X1 [Amblyraja radiata]XP_032889963.1 prominin-1-A-like isoform X1 [Amblyraja radiata]XP_032889964.1 prominin-1-A-like isoform X1 [Amblyraja radiata]
MVMAFWRLLSPFRCELAVLAILAFSTSASSDKDCNKMEGFSAELPEPQYNGNAKPIAGGMATFHNMVHSFLNTVQPNPFPTEIIKLFFENIEMLRGSYTQVLQYEAGYIVCAIIGILLFVLLPLVGLFFCCCRCCGRCGGEMYQELTKWTNRKRRMLAVVLFVLTSVTLAGNVCMFITNEKISENIRESEEQLNNVLGNIKMYINTIPLQVMTIINASFVPVNKVTANLDDIGSSLGEAVKKTLGDSVYPALNTASELAQDINRTNGRLLLVNATAANLIQGQEKLRLNLSAIQQDINDTFTRCGAPCASSQDLVNGLIVIPNFSEIPNMDKEMAAMKSVVKSDLQSFVQKGYRSFNDTPARVTNQSASIVSEAKESVKDIEAQIENIKQEFPLLNSINSITSEIDSINNSINQNRPKIQQANKYRWIVCIVLSCIILLIVVCNYSGLLMGTAFLNSYVGPTQRSSSSHCGGNFLMAGVGFSFIFSWLLILLVFIMFLVGGNVYSLVCKPWHNKELLQAIKTSGLMDKINLEETLGLQSNLNISNVYRDCQNNTSAWKALNLDQNFNLDENLNISQYKRDIYAQFEKLSVDLSDITLLDDEGKNIMKDVLNTGVKDLNFTSFSKQLELPLVQRDLLVTAEQLQNLSKILPDPEKTELSQEAERLKQLNAWIESNMLPNIKTVKENIRGLRGGTSHLEIMVNTTLRKIESAQSVLQMKGSDIVTNESKLFVECQLDYFSQYITWTKKTITEDFAQCRPAANALDSVATISCSYLLDSLNAFWFSMGWSTIFLVPSIIFAVKLAKYYRRMTTSDIYENGGPHFEMRKFDE